MTTLSLALPPATPIAGLLAVISEFAASRCLSLKADHFTRLTLVPAHDEAANDAEPAQLAFPFYTKE